jgi:hypothetical protein
MSHIALPHPVIAPAAAAMETLLQFELVDAEMQSYCIEPIAAGFALIGHHGDILRVAPRAAYIEWDDAHYIAVCEDDIQLVYIYDVTTNIVLSRVGDGETAAVMNPVLRGIRTAYKPTGLQLGAWLRDTVFEVLEMREKRNEALVAEMDEIVTEGEI